MSKLLKSNYPMIDCMKFVAALLVFGVAYSGTYHHLWYMPALIFSFDPEFKKTSARGSMFHSYSIRIISDQLLPVYLA